MCVMASKKTRSKRPAQKAAKKAKKTLAARRQAKPAVPAASATTAPRAKGKARTKTAFVLSFPSTVPAKEVVARGKEEGVALTERAVYKTRYLAKVRAQKAGKKAIAKASPPAAPKAVKAKGRRGAGDGRASALIRETPLEVKANEVVAAARAQGIALTSSLVYSVRAQMKRGGKRPGAPVAVKKVAAAARTVVAPIGELERQLVSLAIDLGLSRAIELIEGVREKVKAMI